MSVGDRVSHWFAGLGTIHKLLPYKSIRVRWDSGSYGIAYAADLKKETVNAR
jgi:hypothetical protein